MNPKIPEPISRRFYRRLVALATIAISAGPALAATYDVTAYGATGNGTTDDKASIQSAIAAASSGDTVYFPTGTYNISGPLLPKSGIIMTGQNETTSIIKYGGTTAGALIRVYQLTNVEISHLTLEGNNNTLAYQGIYAYQGSGHYFHDLTIKDFNATAGTAPIGIQLDGSSSYVGTTNCTISNNTITNLGVTSTWGCGIRCGWGSSSNSIVNNTITTTGRGGIFGNDHSTDLIIQHNTISDSGHTAGPLGIEVWNNCDRALIEDNNLDHWLSLASSNSCAIRRNTVSDPTETRLAYIGLELAIGSDDVFTDNTVNHAQQVGISVSGTVAKNYVYWANNLIEYMVTWGVQLQGDTGGARYHYFYNNQFVHTDQNDPRALYASQGHGFRFNQNDYSIVLDSNTFSNNGGYGIQFSGNIDQLSAVNNTITNNAANGVTTYPATAVDLEWSGNTVTGNSNNTQPTSRGFSDAKPAAAFSSTLTSGGGGTYPAVYAFTNSSSDSDGTIAHVLWDFGDGVPSNTTSPSHAYAAAGSYTVTLIVWDDQGRAARSSSTIVVN